MNQEGFGKRYVGNAEEEEYLTPGDRVTVMDILHPDINLTQTVRPDGKLLLPEVGEVPVAGYTRSDLRAVLTERYSLYFEETDIVVDISSQGRSFWVIGEVGDSGRKEFTGNQVVFEAVMDAVPKRSSANVGRIMLVSGDPRSPLVRYFNLDDIKYGDTTTNYQIRENDIIIVPPTLLAEFGYFLEALLFPVQRVIASVGGALFGGYNNGRNVNNNRALTLGSVF
ncbi:MAG: polysaccharide biosynthesis/export family protein [Planctomycetota bacterium]